MIETLIALSILLIASLFIMQMGLLVYEKSMINHIAFRMARAASMSYLKPDDMLKYYKKVTRKLNRQESQIQLHSFSSGTVAMRAVKVRITQGYRSPIPLVGPVLKKNIFGADKGV